MRDFVESVVLGSFGSAGLVALAGLIFKTRISHWLSKDLEKQKNQYARELEAYKVQLIAETEKIKANQEVKKAGALWILEQKYTALSAMLAALSTLFADVYSSANGSPEGKTQEEFQRLLTRCRTVSNTLAACSSYLPVADQLQISQISMRVNGLLTWCQPNSASYDLEAHAEEVQTALLLEGEAKAMLHTAIKELTSL